MKHPGIPSSSVGVRRLLARLGARFRRVRQRAALAVRGERPHGYFDIHDRELVNGLLAGAALPRLTEAPAVAASRGGHLARGERVYEVRDDVRRAFPLGLTPAQRGDYFDWFLQFGRHETDAEPLDVLRALVEQDGTPDRGWPRRISFTPGGRPPVRTP